MAHDDGISFANKLLSVSTAAILGVLTRVSLNELLGPTAAGLTSPSSALFYDLPANVAGCLVFGAINSLKKHKTIPPLLALAISTGYAGSVTTFASWIMQLVRMLVAGNWLSTFTAVIIGISLPFTALTVGCDLTDFVIHICSPSRPSRNLEEPTPSALSNHRLNKDENPTSTNNSSRKVCRTLVLVFVFALALAATITAAVLDRTTTLRRTHWTAAAFAPVGASTRFLLSFLNPRCNTFPLGTFIANIGGTVLSAAVAAILLQPQFANSITERRLLTAGAAGLAGSLSTISTWVNEAAALSKPNQYRYIVVTFVIAKILAVIIFGTAYWLI